MPKKLINLDYAAATPLIPEVLEAMLPYFSTNFGNANSVHSQGLNSKKALDHARATIAEILNCTPQEIIFTSGGTESNNLAIFGSLEGRKKTQSEFITTTIEHSSILEPLKVLSKRDIQTRLIPVQPNGILNFDTIDTFLSPSTHFASIIYANNEIGTIQNITELSKKFKERNVIFHTDACQAANYENLDTKALGVDLMTLNGSKIYGPKGIGLLYIKAKTPLTAQIYGGGQEFNLRSGTSNIPGIIGLAKALEIASNNRTKEALRLKSLRDKFITEITHNIPGCRLNGDPITRLANNINITIPKVSGRELILHLDTMGIMIGSGSACASTKETPSHVLKAIGLSDEEAKSSIRISLGNTTTEEDINITLKTIINLSKNLS